MVLMGGRDAKEIEETKENIKALIQHKMVKKMNIPTRLTPDKIEPERSPSFTVRWLASRLGESLEGRQVSTAFGRFPLLPRKTLIRPWQGS